MISNTPNSTSPEYIAWRSMKNRCLNSNCDKYAYYGGRGIVVCERWLYSFAAFFEDMGTKPGAEWSLDRIDTNGNYEPANCRWATQIEQCNNRRGNRILTHDGKSMTTAAWERELGFRDGAIRKRLHDNWTVEQALTAPKGANRKYAPTNLVDQRR